jgi:hypothetical protein
MSPGGSPLSCRAPPVFEGECVGIGDAIIFLSLVVLVVGSGAGALIGLVALVRSALRGQNADNRSVEPRVDESNQNRHEAVVKRDP